MNITFKKNGYDYEVFIDNKQTEYAITKHFDFWCIYKGDERIYNWFSTLKEAKAEFIKYIDEQTHYQYIVVNQHTREIIYNTNNYEEAFDIAKENGAVLLSVKYDDFNTPVNLGSTLF